ncbi:MAG: DNA gyrase inhibitor YacG [Burkholderiales bacterium]
MAAKPRKVSCPRCGKSLDWSASNPFRPFCSQRCKLIDLGQWACESYRIPVGENNATDPAEGQ